MAFSRNSLVAAVAGSLSLAMLTGCPAPVTPSPSPSSSTGTPTAAPSTSASTPATTAPSTAPSGSTAPNANASPSTLTPTTLRGKVYDEQGATVSSGAKVTVKSLNPSNPFESTVDVVSGNYVVNNVPAGVQLEITAAKDAWTKRTRVETLLPLTSTQPNIVNFGGPTSGNDDAEGLAYFISKFPEVAAVEPAQDAENVDPTKVSVKLTLSEPLDATNQRRFATALRVVPGDKVASETVANTPGVEGTDFVDLEDDSTTTAVETDFAYNLKEGSLFLEDDATRATVTWDAAGQVATLTFNAPLITGDSDAAKYQIALVAGSTKIQDKDNNQLGNAGNATGGSLSEAYPTGLLSGVFKETDLSLDNPSDAYDRWEQTHTVASTFKVAEDDTDPQLAGVNVVTVGSETRIQLTFSEPMAAYAGDATASGGKLGAGITDPTHYSFAVAETDADLKDVDLDGDSDNGGSADIDASTVTTGVGDTNGAVETEFKISNPASIDVSPTDPKIVRIHLNGATFFSPDVNAIKARVEGVSDPAGNTITSSQADDQVKTGTI